MNEYAKLPLGFEPPIPHLLGDVDEEELALNLGLGLVARKAAEAEYILHGLYVHLVEAERAYSQLAAATGGQLVRGCKTALEASTLPASCRSLLREDLDAADEGIRLRNQYLHGYWINDDESGRWLTLKGSRRSPRAEITFVDSHEVWELAEQLHGLCSRLLHWDISHFGEPSDDEEGHEGLVSRKRN